MFKLAIKLILIFAKKTFIQISFFPITIRPWTVRHFAALLSTHCFCIPRSCSDKRLDLYLNYVSSLFLTII